jgi:murein DD-endopeptidase MepM/ murein hydrolase activator NlpD
VIGYAGATGDVAAPQLHFEIRRGVHAIDPKSLLPKAVVVASN